MVFFFIFLEEKTGGSSEQTRDNFSVSYPEVFETSPKALKRFVIFTYRYFKLS